jgi:hypothetical protein
LARSLRSWPSGFTDKKPETDKQSALAEEAAA